MFAPLLPLVALSLGLAVQDPAPPPALLLLEHEQQGADHVVRLARGGGPFATLRLDGARVPYLWPVCGPGGVEMTRAFPMEEREGEQPDHPHHQSLWFTHGNVNGLDFWHDPKCRIVASGEPAVRTTPGLFEVELTLPLEWRGPEDVAVLTESRRHRFAVRGNLRLIEVRSRLTAGSKDVVFGDTKEGSFGLRVHPELRLKGGVAQGTILNSEGQTDGDCWGQRARWVAYEGPVDDQRVGVCVMDHGKNLRHPTWWHARDYGLVAANPFGIHDFERKPKGTGDYTLKAGETLDLRWLVVLHVEAEGAPTDAPQLDHLWTWWQTEREY